MRRVIKGVALFSIGAAITVLPTPSASATPAVEADPASGTVRVRADEAAPAIPVVPALGSHKTYVAGSSTAGGAYGAEPAGQWCGSVVGVGACARHERDGQIAAVAGACAWYFEDWASSTGTTSCVHAGSCVVSGYYTNPTDCRP
ncbi:MAG TPA: hypothetical protein VI916_06665 [Acidimicrobiia bacterium]|nr:hypothetical protein [Acidimicrobiia bacterium]